MRARALQRWWRHHANTHTHTHTQTHTPKQKTHLNKNTFIARNALEHKNPICEVVAIMTTHPCVSDLWRAILECLDLFNKQVYYRLHVFFHELVVLLLIRGSGEWPAGWNGKQLDSRLWGGAHIIACIRLSYIYTLHIHIDSTHSLQMTVHTSPISFSRSDLNRFSFNLMDDKIPSTPSKGKRGRQCALAMGNAIRAALPYTILHRPSCDYEYFTGSSVGSSCSLQHRKW